MKLNAEIIIKDLANTFCENLKNYEYMPDGFSEFINDLGGELNRFYEEVDKLMYLYQIIYNLDTGLEKHLKICSYKDNPERCDQNMFYYKSKYFTEQEIRKLNPSFEFSILRPNINSDLAKQNLVQLSNFSEAAKLYQSALDKLNAGNLERNLLDDLRLSVELLLKSLLSNNKSLENQKNEIGTFLKQRNASKEIINMYITLIDYFSKYQNDYIKHNDNVKKEAAF